MSSPSSGKMYFPLDCFSPKFRAFDTPLFSESISLYLESFKNNLILSKELSVDPSLIIIHSQSIIVWFFTEFKHSSMNDS